MSYPAKKSLGQHFLIDQNIAKKIVDSISFNGEYNHLLEVGPGKGALTEHLLKLNPILYSAVEIDQNLINQLKVKFPGIHIIQKDILKSELSDFPPSPFGLIGNFPYNISSQILFKVLEFRDNIPEVVGMFQKEVAERICSAPCSKIYGILSVLISAFYKRTYLFNVSENVFSPQPKVQSAVIRLERNFKDDPKCNISLFFKIVKTAFGQRRKILNNSLSVYNLPKEHPLLRKRAEQLSVNDFVELTHFVSEYQDEIKS